jgi:acid stress-induced BolA-like protein IbaG/YrbA
MNQVPTAESIRQSIATALDCEHLSIDGDGHHWEALIVSAAFAGRSRIERHRLVYAALGERMRQEIHALSMRTLTPQEWRAGESAPRAT